MILVTKFGEETVIPDDAIQSILGRIIYRITRYVAAYKLKEGNILMWNEKHQMYVIYRFLDDAIRACFATHSNYGWSDIHASEGELAVLDRFIAESMDWVYLLLDWKAMDPREREAYEIECVARADSLGRVVDEDKRKMQRWMRRATSVIDSKGRENIGRTRSLHSSAAGAGERRRDNVAGISERVDRRKAALLRERQLNLSALREASQRIETILQRMQGVSEGRMGLAMALSAIPPILRATHDRPWRRAFRHSANDIEAAVSALNRGELGKARKKVNIARVALHGLQIHRQISDYRLRLNMALERRPRRDVELDYLFNDLVAMRRFLNANEHPDEEIYRTKLMDRIRAEIDGAIAEWNRGSFPDVKKHLAATADGA